MSCSPCSSSKIAYRKNRQMDVRRWSYWPTYDWSHAANHLSVGVRSVSVACGHPAQYRQRASQLNGQRRVPHRLEQRNFAERCIGVSLPLTSETTTRPVPVRCEHHPTRGKCVVFTATAVTATSNGWMVENMRRGSPPDA